MISSDIYIYIYMFFFFANIILYYSIILLSREYPLNTLEIAHLHVLRICDWQITELEAEIFIDLNFYKPDCKHILHLG